MTCLPSFTPRLCVHAAPLPGASCPSFSYRENLCILQDSAESRQALTPSLHPWKPLVVASVSGLISLCPNWLLDRGPLEGKGGSESVPAVRYAFPLSAALWSAGSSTSSSYHLPRVMPAVRLQSCGCLSNSSATSPPRPGTDTDASGRDQALGCILSQEKRALS